MTINTSIIGCNKVFDKLYPTKVRFEFAKIDNPDIDINIADVEEITDRVFDIYNLGKCDPPLPITTIARHIFDDTANELFRRGLKDVALLSVTVWENDNVFCRIE